MEAKTKRIDLRASVQDEKNLIRAAKKMGEKKVSKVIFRAVEQVAEMEPEQFFCNRLAVRQIDTNIEAGRKMLQNIMDEFLKIGMSVTFAEVQALFGTGRLYFMIPNQEGIKELIINKLFEAQRIKYPGLTFGHDNVQIPDLSNLFEAAGRLVSISEVNNKEVGVYWNCYSVENKIVTVIPDQVEQVKSQFRGFAVTPDERKKLARVKSLCRVLDSFIEDKSISPEWLKIPGICFHDSETGRFEPDIQYIKFGLNQKLIFKK